jgi:hypothetical protein
MSVTRAPSDQPPVAGTHETVAPPPTDQPVAASAPRDAAYWAQGSSVLRMEHAPEGAVNLNVTGRRVTSPIQGFGKMWEKTYVIRLSGATATPREVIAEWKLHFPDFWPAGNRFYGPLTGIAPGEVALLNLSMAPMVRLSTGVMVLYADDESFTLMTPEGHPEAGWITFSAYSDGAHTVCQIQSMARAADPVYEIGFRLIGAKAQEKIWHHVLHSLAGYYGVTGVAVHMQKTCVDPRVQWAAVRNLWHNAGMRSMIYVMGRPVRQLRARPRR